MKKEMIFLVVIMIVAIGYAGFYQKFQDATPHSSQKVVAVTTNTKQQTASSKTLSTSSNVTKVKATVAVDDPLLACSSDAYVCEKAVVDTKEDFGYSDYIWASEGDTITYGGLSDTGAFTVWLESEDGTFSSDVNEVKASASGTFSVDAPFDGNFRVVIQHDKGTGTVNAYIKDPWPE